MKNEPGLNFRSCLCPPLVPLAFQASFLRLFLIYTEPEEWVIADQKTGLFCYPIKNTHGDNVLPVPPCDHRGSTNALGFAHLDAHVGVGISKLEVGSHRCYNKRQFFSFIIIFFFKQGVGCCTSLLLRSPNFLMVPQWQTLCQRRGLCRYLRAWGENFFFLLSLFQTMELTQGQKWVTNGLSILCLFVFWHHFHCALYLDVVRKRFIIVW